MTSEPPAPLPTRWRDRLYRSRLEARVAATLDRHRIGHRYEEEAHAVPGGRGYLPDFHLTHLDGWLEVKHGYRAPGIDKAEALAVTSGRPVWLAYPADVYPTQGLAVVLLGEEREACVWAPCPGCDAVQPWPIRRGSYRCRACGIGYGTREWRTGWEGWRARNGLPYLIPLPQYLDGLMLWHAEEQR